jgi:hypothetical protein
MPRRKLNGEQLLNSIVSDLAHQRPQMTKKQAEELETVLLERWASARRTGLELLTVSGKKLIGAIAGKRVDQSVAIDKLKLAYSLRQYAERLACALA